MYMMSKLFAVVLFFYTKVYCDESNSWVPQKIQHGIVCISFQAFRDRNLNFGSLPAALRKVMVTKFADFDKYQLGKFTFSLV